MPGFFIGTSPLKEAYVGTTPVKEIYVGTTKVRPTKKAFPYYTTSSSTLLYCPLNEDLTDKTGNYTMTASGTPTTGEYDGIDVTYFNKNYIRTTANYNWSETLTVSFAAKLVGSGGSFCGQRATNGPWRWFIGTGSTYQSYTSNYARSRIYTLPSGWFTCTVILYASSGAYADVYFNGSIASTTTGGFSGSIGGQCPIYIGFEGNGSSTNLQAYISNMIIEKGAWNSTKITNWHNTIKDYYGIN